ncbi:FAD-dependent oxidoreductase [Leucobacter sp. CSA2]|uniref:FAD-dependent oxidoreductase n=1 Tax=Leucobacter edaphi TaxID=2796472 RepID=A0A934UXC8_9MICO|nr:FAD-dependent oxidoreductase [Leucobacter edaphi]MBK0422614.1 FAD-dependent oxidoreductase [Leucobacter edaphi]
MTKTDFPHLFAPLELGGITLPNRVIMGSMHLGFEEDADGPERLAAFYRERAAAGAALIVTGGVSPNAAGRLTPGSAVLDDAADLSGHRTVTSAVHAAGGRIALQLLHAGRYAAHPGLVAPSPLQAPISPLPPRELSSEEIEQTVEDYARAARLAREAGYDGVEIMGSEGYLINQFTAPRTNHRSDRWGGDFAGRTRFPLEVLRSVRAAVGPEFLIIYRLSMLDLVPDGAPFAEVAELARLVEEAGASAINTGIGWHEARVPTIAGSVPRAAFAWVTKRLSGRAGIPLITTNRINTPETAERLIAEGVADMVSLARPFLADPEFVSKAQAGRSDRINTCIGCNQACLDHTFAGKPASCLVNPRAGRETELLIAPAIERKRIAVVGSGPAGLACATTAASRGHSVTLYEAAERIGGQLNLALQVPGKSEFRETLRYFAGRIEETGVELRLGQRATAGSLAEDAFDEVVIATGVLPRTPEIPGIDRPEVLGYIDAINGAHVGDRVAILGSGAIGFDVAEALTQLGEEDPADIAGFLAHWGVDPAEYDTAGLATAPPAPEPSARSVVMLQRRAGKPGAGLGKTTGWIHRAELSRRGVQMLAGVNYLGIDDAGLRIEVDGEERVLEVDSVVVCAGQEPDRGLADALAADGITAHIIGGADVAAELDAKRAIDQGTRLAAML